MIRAACAFVSLFAAAVAAQTPVVITGGTLSGLVRDVAGAPVAGATVSLVGEAGSTRTDGAGHFALRGVPAGRHTALFRRLGFRSVEYRWAAQSGVDLQIAVAMAVLPRQLDRVVVEAPGVSHRRGTSVIAGTVIDSAGRAVSGADVRLLGAGLSTMSDTAGRFAFGGLAAGYYIVRARRPGLASTNYVMQVVDDDNRGITLTLYGLAAKTGPRDTMVASGYGVADLAFDAFDRRERGTGTNPMFGPGDLFRADRAPLDLMLQRFIEPGSARGRRSPAVVDAVGSARDGECLLIDGRRAAYQPLRSFTSVDVQLIEVIRPNEFVGEFVLSQMEALTECRGSMDHHPSYFVLWTRSLR
jgi:hypothetical protein